MVKNTPSDKEEGMKALPFPEGGMVNAKFEGHIICSCSSVNWWQELKSVIIVVIVVIVLEWKITQEVFKEYHSKILVKVALKFQ